MTAFSIKDLTVVKDSKTILDSISFDVDEGDFVCLVGPSGAGKSTLLRQLNRLDFGKTAGSITWKGKDLSSYEVHELRQQIAYIFQKAVMFPGTTEENIRLGCHYEKNLTKAQINDRLEKAYRIAQLPKELLPQQAKDLSGGQQQRVGIARCLMLAPSVFLFDEPTASLDVETSHNFCEMLKEFKQHLKEEKTVSLMITHRLEEAQFLADKVLMLDEGKIVTYQGSDSFFNNPDNPRVIDFLKAYKL